MDSDGFTIRVRVAYDALAVLFVGVMLGILIGVNIWFSTPSINCPAEDSCHADYYDGSWHILVNEDD